MQLIIGLLTVDVYIPGSNSLKEKRVIIKGLKDKVRKKFNVSIAEVDYHEKWQRAKLGIVQVGNDYSFIEKNIDKIFDIIDSNGSLHVVEHTFEFI
ncbi:MAG: DUF503 domain-containing protein [Calditrichia bacterium]